MFCWPALAWSVGVDLFVLRLLIGSCWFFFGTVSGILIALFSTRRYRRLGLVIEDRRINLAMNEVL